MKKILFVAVLILVGSLAANAKVFTFDFDGFCDGIDATRSGSPAVYLSGFHDFTGCGISTMGVVGGFKHGHPLTVPPAVNPIDDFSDDSEAAVFGTNYTLNYLVHEPSATAGCIWANYYSNGSGEFLIHADSTCTSPTHPTRRQAGLPSSLERR